MNRESGLVVPLLLALLLVAIGFAAFTGYVAYCGMHEFSLPDAFERPPREDAARLGGVLEAGLSWAMRACGMVVLLTGAALALRRSAAGVPLEGVVTVLAGAVLITQHWAAAVALAVMGAAAALALAWHESSGRRLSE